MKLTRRIALVMCCLRLRRTGYRVHLDRHSAFLVIDGGRHGPKAERPRRVRLSPRQASTPPAGSAA